MRAVQAHHGVAQSGEGAADLAVAALTHANVPLGAAIGPETGEDEPARAIGQLDAVVADHLLVERFEWVVEPDVVFFDLGKLRMGHAVGKVAVVAEQKQAGAIGIEPANGLERVQFWRQKVVDGGLIPLLFARADVTDWLVEHNSAVGNLLGQWCALYRYQAAWLEAGTEHSYLAINYDISSGDQVIRLAARQAQHKSNVFVKASSRHASIISPRTCWPKARLCAHNSLGLMLMGMTRPRPSNRRNNAPRAAKSSLANGTNAREKRAMFDLWHNQWVLKRWMLAAISL